LNFMSSVTQSSTAIAPLVASEGSSRRHNSRGNAGIEHGIATDNELLVELRSIEMTMKSPVITSSTSSSGRKTGDEKSGGDTSYGSVRYSTTTTAESTTPSSLGVLTPISSSALPSTVPSTTNVHTN
jgi:hypothetical protein